MNGPAPAAPTLAERLVAETFEVRDGVLRVGGRSVDALVREHGSPLYVYDAGLVARRHRALADALAGFAEVFYSIKANPNPAIARVLVEAGAGIEIASGAEFLAARAAGAEPARILFAGPGKGEAELALAIEGGLGELHVETLEEIACAGAIAARAGRALAVSVRVNPVAAAQGGAMRMGGRPTAFGFDEEGLDAAIAAVGAWPALRLAGVHVYAGTQVLDAQVLVAQWAHGLDVAARVAHRLGRPLESVDLGGGLGIPYHAGDATLDLDAVADGARRLAHERLREPAFAGTRVLVEPGRWLVGPAGVYLATVRAVKRSKGQRFVVIDGGMHHHLAASGNLGQVVKRDYPIVAATRLDDDRLDDATLAGPLCTPLDTIGRQTRLPAALEPGDVIAVLQSGAYGLTASPVGFLGHPMPAEVLVADGVARTIRPRGSFERPLSAPCAPR